MSSDRAPPERPARPADAQEPVAPRADQPAGAAPAPSPVGERAPAPKTGPPPAAPPQISILSIT